MLQHDKVTLALGVLHFLLERGAQAVESSATWLDLVVAEETEPAQTGQDTLLVLGVAELGLGADGPRKVRLGVAGGTDNLAESLLPGNWRLEEILLLVAEEAELLESLDEGWVALIAQSSTNEGLGLWDVVSLTEWGAVTVGVGLECVAWVDKVWLGGAHEVSARDRVLLAVLEEGGGVAGSQKHTTWGPRELVAKRVVRALWCWETTAVRQETGNLATSLVDLRDGLDSVKVVKTWVEANLVEDGDSSLLGLLVERHHGVRDVGSCDNILLLVDGSLDNLCVEGVWDQRDDQVNLADLLLQRLSIGNIDSDGIGVLEALSKLLGALQSAASYEYQIDSLEK